MKCPSCGADRKAEDRCCPYCRTPFDPYATVPEQPVIHVHVHHEAREESRVRVEHVYTTQQPRYSQRKRLIALLLCLLFGTFGVHRFYLGKIGTGFLYLCTYGLFGVGYVVDLVVLLIGRPRDKQGQIVQW